MKKILILLIPFLLTGCFNGILNGELSKTCTKKELSSILEENITYYIEFKRGKINNITLTNTFNSLDDSNISIIKNSINTYKITYQNEEGINIDTTDNSIIYRFDLNKISQGIKDNFNLNNDYNNQIKKLESMGFDCK